MIGIRTPFRISFAGGGSDLRSFYTRHPGHVLSTSVNKYMYILIHPFFDRKIQVKYSRTELVDRADQIQHPIVRAALERFHIEGVDINSIADIPAGTGLGSSCAFTVGLLHSLYVYLGQFVSKETLAREACKIEIDILNEPIGKQDQYAAAYGGLNFMTFYPNEKVDIEPIIMPGDTYRELMDNLVMFYLGAARPAREILSDQQKNVENDKAKFHNLVRMTQLAVELKNSLTRGNIHDVGLILDENWTLKRKLSAKIAPKWIDAYYQKAKRNGAVGGKVLGAGGGGFLLLYSPQEHQERLKRAMGDLRPFEFRFDTFGTKVIYYEDYEAIASRPQLRVAA